MSRILSILKALGYKLRYRNSLQWEGMLRCKKVADIKIQSGKLRIGKGFDMYPGAYIAVVDKGVMTVGDGVAVNRNAMIICHDSVAIGDGCRIGPNVLIYDHDHNFGAQGLEEGYITAPVVIGKNCWIGGNVTILRGTTIGDGCVIGAGAVVKGNIPAHMLVTADRGLKMTPIGNAD